MAASPGAVDYGDLLAHLEPVVREAGALILQVYAGNFAVRGKADASPVTEADERAEALIVAALEGLQPTWPVVAEEAASRGPAPPAAERFWLVDPLDGTREFVSRNGEFTVNIALVEQGLPVLGLVYVPVADLLYTGAEGQGAWLVDRGQRRAIRCRSVPALGPTLATSRSHGDEASLQAWLTAGLRGRPLAGRITSGSSLKFGLLAEGRADLYPRLSRTMEWDTAAGHAVLAAAGGQVLDLSGQPLRYGKPGYENPHFVACGRR